MFDDTNRVPSSDDEDAPQPGHAAAGDVAQSSIPRARPLIVFDSPQTLGLGEDPMLLPAARASHAWIDLARLTVFMVLFELAAAGILSGLTDVLVRVSPTDAVAWDEAYGELQRVLLLPILLLRAAASIFVIALIVRQRRQTAASLGLQREALGVNLLVGAVSTAFVYGLTVVSMTILWFLWPKVNELMQQNVQRLQAIIPPLHPIGLICLSLTVGIYEELLFRGFLMTRLRRAVGNWPLAVVISTAVFTALHWPDQTAPALVPVAILSIVFSVVTIQRRSLIPAIVGHALFDLTQLLYMYVSSGGSWK